METRKSRMRDNILPFLKSRWYLLVLGAIAILSFGLNFYAISKVGYGNAYYAAAIKSMTQSFKNFFFVSFDPAGLVSVDKPPLALWIQAIFVLIFGYHGWVMLLPQALAGTGSCIMMYVLTAKHFGRPAGLISSLTFALTPAVVVAARNNTMDMQLIFVLLVATWFLFKAIETSKWRPLFLAALFVGLGFNIKMLQAYMILPAVGIVYLFFSKEKMVRRIIGSVISIAIVFAVSFAWVFAVDLYPSGSRPYVGSSTNNTVMELIFGHNGTERISGQGGGVGGRKMGGNFGGSFEGNNNRRDGNFGGQQRTDGQGQQPQTTQQNGNNNNGNTNNGTANNGTPPAMPGQNNGNNGTNGATGNAGNTGNNNGTMQMPSGQDGIKGGGFGGNGTRTGGAVGNDIGSAGILRLWDSSMYGQASWLLVLIFFCIAAKIPQLKKFSIKALTLRQGIYCYWILWLVTMCVFFSFASFFHRYYLCMIAPGAAALAGIGIVDLYKAFRDKKGWQQWLLPLSLLATAVINVIYVWSYSALRSWLVPVIVISAAAALILMMIYRIGSKRFTLLLAVGSMLISVLAGPFYWSLTAVMYVPENITMPYAGPELASTTKTVGMTANQETYVSADSQTLALENYLVKNYKAGSYLVVAQRANDVAEFIVDTGLPAVAYGGFLGSDNAMTLNQLKALVKEGKVTYFLISSQGGMGGNFSSELVSYVKENATLISPSEYGSTSSGSSTQSGTSLYCFK